ncbi:hypothetical protein K7432_018514 [Basidiobolus ranarum]|uniref:Uncharacterized protein n=1 Tax=Basidiobolus ranarum TaxID=34480 RepID=A0ABR2VIX2_9FUNG
MLLDILNGVQTSNLLLNTTLVGDDASADQTHNEEEIGSNRSDKQRISQVDISISGCSDPHSDEPAITHNRSNEPSLIEEEEKDDDNDDDETTTVFKRPRTS